MKTLRLLLYGFAVKRSEAVEQGKQKSANMVNFTHVSTSKTHSRLVFSEILLKRYKFCGSKVLTLYLFFTYWLKQVDERFLLDYDNWHRSDACSLEQGAHRCHNLVKTPTKTSQGHNYIYLSKAKQN